MLVRKTSTLVYYIIYLFLEDWIWELLSWRSPGQMSAFIDSSVNKQITLIFAFLLFNSILVSIFNYS